MMTLLLWWTRLSNRSIGDTGPREEKEWRDGLEEVLPAAIDQMLQTKTNI